jgi:hypothetical protein
VCPNQGCGVETSLIKAKSHLLVCSLRTYECALCAIDQASGIWPGEKVLIHGKEAFKRHITEVHEAQFIQLFDVGAL